MNFYGLFGKPVGHSISPQLHKKIYEEAEIEAAYKTFELAPQDLQSALDAMVLLDIGGCNVTIPYKKEFISLMDDISPLAQQLGSVNTIKQDKGKFYGYNTDYDGIERTFNLRNWQVKGKRAYIMGHGGAAEAVIQFLKNQAAQDIILVSRHPEDIASDLAVISYKELETVRGDILINTTPVGMSPNEGHSPVSQATVGKFNILFDLIYNPAETEFLRFGNALGKQTANGLDMLVGQAIKSVEIWEEMQIDAKKIDNILNYFHRNWS